VMRLAAGKEKWVRAVRRGGRPSPLISPND